MDLENNDLNWLDEFEELADETLGDGSACEQVHPVVADWFEEWLESDIPSPRISVSQALACLATEIISYTPDTVLETLMEHFDEEDLFQWVQGILMTGQAFQIALTSGRLDDL